MPWDKGKSVSAPSSAQHRQKSHISLVLTSTSINIPVSQLLGLPSNHNHFKAGPVLTSSPWSRSGMVPLPQVHTSQQVSSLFSPCSTFRSHFSGSPTWLAALDLLPLHRHQDPSFSAAISSSEQLAFWSKLYKPWVHVPGAPSSSHTEPSSHSCLSAEFPYFHSSDPIHPSAGVGSCWQRERIWLRCSSTPHQRMWLIPANSDNVHIGGRLLGTALTPNADFYVQGMLRNTRKGGGNPSACLDGLKHGVDWSQLSSAGNSSLWIHNHHS